MKPENARWSFTDFLVISSPIAWRQCNGLLTAFATLSLSAFTGLGCTSSPQDTRSLRILLPDPPLTLNPRHALDAIGQRLDALIFRGLTHIDANLEPQPDLAESWKVSDGGKTWKFKIRPGLVDQGGQPIDADRIARCLESYHTGKPTAGAHDEFPSWKVTRTEAVNTVVLEFGKPDPYVARNLSLFRYFRAEKSGICQDPASGEKWFGSGRFRPSTQDLTPQEELLLEPSDGKGQAVRFSFVRDENTRAMKLIRGEADAVLNGLPLSKTRWLQATYPKQFRIVEREGVVVSYLAFNLSDPILKIREVRQAIAESIDRESVVKYKMFGFGTVADSLLSPGLSESQKAAFRFDPAHAEHLLDQAGFSRGKDGVRIRLKYRTTPVREGFETAMIFQDMLRKVGIELTLEITEPAVFLASVRKGAFQMYSSRWVGIADGSILFHILHRGESNNRVHYSNPEVDALLDQAMAEPELTRRIPLLQQIQTEMAADLPYFPLWFWSNALIVNLNSPRICAEIKARRIPSPEQLSLSGALEPLMLLREP